METLVLGGIGLAAASYLAYIIWQGAHGQPSCDCGNAGTCGRKSGACACGGKMDKNIGVKGSK